MRKSKLTMFVGIFAGLVALGWITYLLPPVNQRLAWRVDIAQTYLRGMLQPAGDVPRAFSSAPGEALPPPQVIVTSLPTATSIPLPSLTDTPGPSPTPSPSPTPLPTTISLPPPAWEKQDINNCGPASLAMHLRYFGWQGDQFEIAELLKPERRDRNVNVEELAYYVRTRVGWLHIEYRVGGDLELLKRLLAAGLPVMVEESYFFDSPFYPNDDLWAAHYNLLTGYDDASQTFTAQDSYYGANQQIAYTKLDEYWQSFNRVYILIYPPEYQETVKAILGTDWDANLNRQHALATAQQETQTQPKNAFAWFNLGSNLVYFERYAEAALAYDEARELGLPQRMLRYQFGPFHAYFHTGRMADLMALAEYALQRTPNAEEALLWRGWGYYRQGKVKEALADFRQALQHNPNYQDAHYALDFVLSNP